MYKNRFRGFTLIELLVVIAIIGILSAVVLASLNTARSKGTDAAIKSNLDTVRTQLVIDYDSYPSAYGDAAIDTIAAPAVWGVACTGTSGSAGIGLSATAASCDTSIGNALKGAGTMQVKLVAGTSGSYVVESALTATTGTYWCIDSTGISKAESALLATGATKCIP